MKSPLYAFDIDVESRQDIQNSVILRRVILRQGESGNIKTSCTIKFKREILFQSVKKGLQSL